MFTSGAKMILIESPYASVLLKRHVSPRLLMTDVIAPHEILEFTFPAVKLNTVFMRVMLKWNSKNLVTIRGTERRLFARLLIIINTAKWATFWQKNLWNSKRRFGEVIEEWSFQNLFLIYSFTAVYYRPGQLLCLRI
jgi:hypothetical protein